MGRIVVGADGSPNSIAALRWAVEEAGLRACSLDVITAWEYPVTAAAGAVVPLEPLAAQGGEALLELQASLDGAGLVLDNGGQTTEGLMVEAHVEEGSPSAVLVAASKGATLVVIGGHSRGGLMDLLLGSVSKQVAAHAHCPVVIVRGEPHQHHRRGWGRG